uniref:Nuclear transcription factor Y subunit gamma n=1 Tax=Octopus bimaculoides TaxID=37653 RepID=A0A0L8H789_OCTBM
MSGNDPVYQPTGSATSGISNEATTMLQTFWPHSLEGIKKMTQNEFKSQELPLARIKKIMKLDEDVKMISAEAPVLFAKAAEIFISELSLRAWIHTEDNKRRTLQRNDIAMAITKFDQFDFLIDIVPRDELKPPKRQKDTIDNVVEWLAVGKGIIIVIIIITVIFIHHTVGDSSSSSSSLLSPSSLFNTCFLC